MPTVVTKLQVANQNTRERIQQIIEAESADLSGEYSVSIIDSRDGDIWELSIKRPDGSEVSMQLHADMGDLSPAVMRIKLRELLKLL